MKILYAALVGGGVLLSAFLWAKTHGPAPFDLVADSYDDNGFAKNPRWGTQDRYSKQHPGAHLWEYGARPDIMRDCLSRAAAKDPANIGTLNDGYNPFLDGYQRSHGA